MKKSICGCKSFLGILAGCLLVSVASVFGQPSVVPTINFSTATHQYTNWSPQASDFRLGANGKAWDLISPALCLLPGVGEMTIQGLTFDPDPLVQNNILVQNISGVNQIYSVLIGLPTTFAGPNLIRGSISTSLIGTAAAVSTTAPFPIYAAQIDGVTVKALQSNPFSLTTASGAVNALASYGFELNAAPVTSSMGILLRFELTPGDTVSILSDFEIVAVPEPSTLALLLLGGGALVLRRNRR